MLDARFFLLSAQHIWHPSWSNFPAHFQTPSLQTDNACVAVKCDFIISSKSNIFDVAAVENLLGS